MNAYWFDYGSALLAAISAMYWARSAMVDTNFGYDMDAELNKAMKTTARLNAIAAGFAAAAAVVPAVKTFGAWIGWIV